jgi:hypothetical protein
MKRFLKSAGSVLLTLVLALAWTWTGLLKDAKYIDDNQRFWILVSLTILLTLQQIYLVIPKPEKRGVVEARRAINENYLQLFRLKYERTVATLNQGKGCPPVRVNIMLPVKKVRGLFGAHLRMFFHAVPLHHNYTDEEKSLKWSSKEGTCGWAWKYGEYSISDSVMPQLKLPEGRIKRDKVSIVSHIKSTLSIPIWYDGKIVGVFNLDSDLNVTETRFDDSEIYILAAGFANTLGGQCYRDGVEA